MGDPQTSSKEDSNVDKVLSTVFWTCRKQREVQDDEKNTDPTPEKRMTSNETRMFRYIPNCFEIFVMTCEKILVRLACSSIFVLPFATCCETNSSPKCVWYEMCGNAGRLWIVRIVPGEGVAVYEQQWEEGVVSWIP